MSVVQMRIGFGWEAGCILCIGGKRWQFVQVMISSSGGLNWCIEVLVFLPSFSQAKDIRVVVFGNS